MVSFVKINNDAIASYKYAIIKSLDLVNYSFPHETKNIVIKPNMCYYWDYTTGETTDPQFVGALIEVLRENISPNVNISIVESDASAMKCKHAFKILGYEKMSHEYDVKLVNLSEDPTETVETCAGGYNFKFQIPQTIQNADLKINVPKIKYSVPQLQITCALKNIFGCNPFPKKFKYHPQIWEVIVALNKLYNFNLCLIDGNIVSGIKPRKISLVMASRDPVAIDAAASKIMGINPTKVKYVQLAAKEGLGSIDFINKGVPLENFKAIYPRKGIKNKLTRQAYELVVTMGLNKKLGLP
ncbi:MAG: DUF362 domain-containing protein [Candidatus Bathyarchaeum tardum]|nr:MAG: DUF362 domain-containing protein [Candidatus Bathyarchaeum tardum]